MYSIAISPVKTRAFKPRLALVAATLFAALLVVALTVVAPFMRSLSTQPTNPAAANKQTLTDAQQALDLYNATFTLKGE